MRRPLLAQKCIWPLNTNILAKAALALIVSQWSHCVRCRHLLRRWTRPGTTNSSISILVSEWAPAALAMLALSAASAVSDVLSPVGMVLNTSSAPPYILDAKHSILTQVLPKSLRGSKKEVRRGAYAASLDSIFFSTHYPTLALTDSTKP